MRSSPRRRCSRSPRGHLQESLDGKAGNSVEWKALPSLSLYRPCRPSPRAIWMLYAMEPLLHRCTTHTAGPGVSSRCPSHCPAPGQFQSLVQPKHQPRATWSNLQPHSSTHSGKLDSPSRGMTNSIRPGGRCPSHSPSKGDRPFLRELVGPAIRAHPFKALTPGGRRLGRRCGHRCWQLQAKDGALGCPRGSSPRLRLALGDSDGAVARSTWCIQKHPPWKSCAKGFEVDLKGFHIPILPPTHRRATRSSRFEGYGSASRPSRQCIRYYVCK